MKRTGGMAERLGSGLQIRLQRFNSASHLHFSTTDELRLGGLRRAAIFLLWNCGIYIVKFAPGLITYYLLPIPYYLGP